MKAAVLYEVRQPLRIEELEMPAVNYEDVLIKTFACIAEYVSLAGYMIFKLPQEISLEEENVIGCRVTTAYNSVKHVGELAPGDSALVIGCGGVGLNAIQFLKCFGAYPIIAVDVIDKKLEEAKKFGATHTINAKTEDPVSAVKKLASGGVEKAFEANGNAKTAEQVIWAKRP